MSSHTDALLVPFDPALVQWEPIAFTQTRMRALAYPTVATVHYVERLNMLFPNQWSVAYTPWREAVICHLTLLQKSMSQVGQLSGRTGTYRSAADDALQRACHLFGLGLYLEKFPTQWECYDPAEDNFTPAALERLANLAKGYKRRPAVIA